MSVGQSAATRRSKKLLAKSQWFKTPTHDQQEEDGQAVLFPGPRVADGGRSGSSRSSKKEVNTEKKSIRTTTVLFMELTRGGVLQKKILYFFHACGAVVLH